MAPWRQIKKSSEIHLIPQRERKTTSFYFIFLKGRSCTFFLSLLIATTLSPHIPQKKFPLSFGPRRFSSLHAFVATTSCLYEISENPPTSRIRRTQKMIEKIKIKCFPKRWAFNQKIGCPQIKLQYLEFAQKSYLLAGVRIGWLFLNSCSHTC